MLARFGLVALGVPGEGKDEHDVLAPPLHLFLVGWLDDVIDPRAGEVGLGFSGAGSS
jgi:hypothetical protein